MKPNFSKVTVEMVAKRAAFKCSNPDCRTATIGPNTDVNKAILIGEAAHIYGAREGSKRYRNSMCDSARAEITNAIWLCRNCHKMIDTDETRYSSAMLFAWRSLHEEYVLSELGNISDKIYHEDNNTKIKPFESYPPIIKRIVIDEPIGWEWRLASELLIYLNAPLFKKMENLTCRLYTKPLQRVEFSDFIGWFNLKIAEIQQLIPPFEGLLENLTLSFGPPGHKGDLNEIHQVCCLISEYLKQVIELEESLYFVSVPDECSDLVSLLRGNIGSQAMKLADIPNTLNEVVEKANSDNESPSGETEIVTKTIEIVLPDNWSSNVEFQLNKISRLLS